VIMAGRRSLLALSCSSSLVWKHYFVGTGE
jgi:hypothetical protein